VKELIAWFDQLQKDAVSVSALPALAASYDVTPPTSWSQGQSQTYTITLTNTGSDAWLAGGPNPVHLGVSFGGASEVPGVGWVTDQRIALPNNVAPGGAVTLTITVTAPGAAGSYILRHWMVKELVAWFDQERKDAVTVSSVPALAAAYNVSPPTSWSQGQSQTYTITVTNQGAETWLAGGATPVHLGVSFGGASEIPGVGWITDQRFALPSDIAPGASVTLTITVTAPSTAGSYTLRHWMVKELVAWFDQAQNDAVTVSSVPALAATYSVAPPTTWAPSQSQTYTVTLANTGSETWFAGGATPVHLGVSFGGASEIAGVDWVTDQRFALPNDVAPGGSVTLTITVTAPSASGSYTLRHWMVKELVAWFDQQQKDTVTVTP
jgi:hypothetical protein